MTWALATIAALLIGYATVSRRLERLNVSGAMFFTTAGLLVGPVLGLLDLEVHGEQVKLLAEITLTLVLFADASRISLRALRHEFAVPLRLLGIGLPLTIVAGALIGARSCRESASRRHWCSPSCSRAPTPRSARRSSPTSASRRAIRQGLNVESGLNDGLCVPLFFIAIAIAETDAGTASSHSAAQLVFEQIGYGLIGGVVAGALGGARAAARRAPAADRATLAADPQPSPRRCSRPASRPRWAAASSSPRSRVAFCSARCDATPAAR